MIRTIEETSMNSWPAQQSLLHDGWVLTLSEGISKRCNCVVPLYGSKNDVLDKIKYCEAVYRNKNLRVLFKISSATKPAELDDVLENQFYARVFDTSVQILDLETIDLKEKPNNIVDFAHLNYHWLLAYYCFKDVNDDATKNLYVEKFSKIATPKCFLALKVNDMVVGTLIGVIDNGYLGIFDLVIDEKYRRQGFGQLLLENILIWGKQNKAKTAYLQVFNDNVEALQLYNKLGFTELYQYWYRQKK
jgi:ribosomal protein S18 acetylase RimI-like enzyme